MARNTAPTTAERLTEVRTGGARMSQGRKARDLINGESCATVQVASSGTGAPTPATNWKSVRAGEGGGGPACGATARGMIVADGNESLA